MYICEKACVYVGDQLKTWIVLKLSENGPDGFKVGPTASKQGPRFSLLELLPIALKPALMISQFFMFKIILPTGIQCVVCPVRCLWLYNSSECHAANLGKQLTHD